MPLYSFDVPVWATGYVRAKDRREAQEIASNTFRGVVLDVKGELVSELMFDDPNLPDVSLSSVATISDDYVDLLDEVG